MEENKNNAIEKTENITDNLTQSKKDKVELASKNQQNREDIAEQKLLKKQERQNLKIQKRNEKQNNKNNRKGYGGWLAAVISLGCAVLVLGGLLTLSYFTPLDDYMANTVNGQKNFYDLVSYVDNIDVNLSKLVVSNDSEKQQKILSEVRVQSSLATNSISSLALQDENKYNTTKFINQVGDFCKYLNNKLIEEKPITEKDKETLYNLYQINLQLKQSLQDLASQIDENFDFSSIYEGKKDNLVISKFIELESNATEYPHMIYDGAFSDGVKGKTLKALEGEKEVSKSQAKELFSKYFSKYNLKEVTLNGEIKGKDIECYDITGVSDDGSVLDAQISKKGGKIILFNYYKECAMNNYDATSCEEIVDKFLESLGISDMKAVWMTEGNHLVTFNYASVVDGVICYSDLIKINVCKERGVISGMEASSYYYNHAKRDIPIVKISLDEAKSKVSSEIEVASSRLAIIPKGNESEVLTYEFTGDRNGDFYYIYIDAISGKEVDIFKVVKTTEGTLLM